MIKVMISDPDLFTREGIKQLLTQFDDIDVVCEASSISETLHAARETDADVILVGIDISRQSNLGLLRRIKLLARKIPLLAMGRVHERDFALRAIRAGATGYLSKAGGADQLAHAIRTSSTHRPYVNDIVCEMIVESIVDVRASRQYDKLSDTDFEIFCLMAEGLTTAQIALACNLSIATVRTRRSRIREQTGLQNEAELVEYAIKRKLIAQML